MFILIVYVWHVPDVCLMPCVCACRRHSSIVLRDGAHKRRSYSSVKFEEAESEELETLVVNPDIVIDPPSSTASATTTGTKNDVKVIGQSKKRT